MSRKSKRESVLLPKESLIKDNIADYRRSSRRKDVRNVGSYILGATLGEGAFGKVKLASHFQSRQNVAIKILDKTKMNEEEDDFFRVQKEISVLKKMRHKNIIQLYEIMESVKNIYLVMEYCEGKELFDYIVMKKQLTEAEALKYFQQIIDAVEYMHSQNIVHRDLKPENILLDDKLNVKLSDFGLSTNYSNENLLSTPCGTPSYAPPEMLKGEEYHGLLSDVWSTGIILYAMLCGYLPFSESDQDINCKNIIEGNYELPESLSPQVKDLLKNILQIDPLDRYDIDQIKKHPWFTSKTPCLRPGLIIDYHRIPIDEIILNKLIEHGYNKEKVRKNLVANKFDQTTAIYYLYVKKHLKEGHTSISDLQSQEYLDFINDSNNILNPGVTYTCYKTLKTESEMNDNLNNNSNCIKEKIKDNNRKDQRILEDALCVETENMCLETEKNVDLTEIIEESVVLAEGRPHSQTVAQPISKPATFLQRVSIKLQNRKSIFIHPSLEEDLLSETGNKSNNFIQDKYICSPRVHKRFSQVVKSNPNFKDIFLQLNNPRNSGINDIDATSFRDNILNQIFKNKTIQTEIDESNSSNNTNIENSISSINTLNNCNEQTKTVNKANVTNNPKFAFDKQENGLRRNTLHTKIEKNVNVHVSININTNNHNIENNKANNQNSNKRYRASSIGFDESRFNIENLQKKKVKPLEIISNNKLDSKIDKEMKVNLKKNQNKAIVKRNRRNSVKLKTKGTREYRNETSVEKSLSRTPVRNVSLSPNQAKETAKNRLKIIPWNLKKKIIDKKVNEVNAIKEYDQFKDKKLNDNNLKPKLQKIKIEKKKKKEKLNKNSKNKCINKINKNSEVKEYDNNNNNERDEKNISFGNISFKDDKSEIFLNESNAKEPKTRIIVSKKLLKKKTSLENLKLDKRNSFSNLNVFKPNIEALSQILNKTPNSKLKTSPKKNFNYNTESFKKSSNFELTDNNNNLNNKKQVLEVNYDEPFDIMNIISKSFDSLYCCLISVLKKRKIVYFEGNNYKLRCTKLGLCFNIELFKLNDSLSYLKCKVISGDNTSFRKFNQNLINEVIHSNF